MIIGVDVDCVLAKYNEALAKTIEDCRGLTPGSLPSPKSWDFPEWGLDRESFRFYHSILMTNIVDMEVIENSAEVLKSLQTAGHFIKIVTSRGSAKLHDDKMRPKVYKGTIDWLDKHKIPYDDICFVENKCQVKADVYIEDSPHHLQAMHDAGLKYISFAYEYNAHIPTTLLRTNKWISIMDKLFYE